MSLTLLGLSLSLFWVAAYYFGGRRSSSDANSSILPITTSSRTRATRGLKLPQVDISVHHFHLKVTTTAFNARHDRLSSYVSKSRRLRRLTTLFYDLGVLVAAVGFFVGLGLLGYTILQLFFKFSWANRSVGGRGIVDDVEGLMRRFKRDLSQFQASQPTPSSITTATTSGTELALFPIIPGVTIPFSDLPILLLSLFITQVIHEAGHALVAALEGIPLYSVGASLTVLLPSAFTSLAPSFSSLTARSRLRIVSAGVWHNLLLWAVLYVVPISVVVDAWSWVGWRDVSAEGVVVVSVEHDSPLAFHLDPGTLIRALDDLSLGANSTSLEAWTSYLDSEEQPTRGWCVSGKSYAGAHSKCCQPNYEPPGPPAPSLSCFLPLDLSPNQEEKCLDPLPILTPSDSDQTDNAHPTLRRCSSYLDCGGEGHDICMKPRAEADLMRITVVDTYNDGQDEVVLWSGPRMEVWEQVQVGKHLPRLGIFPVWLPGRVLLLIEYISTITLSLFFFNLLNLPFLDGAQLVPILGEVVVEWYRDLLKDLDDDDGDIDLEDLGPDLKEGGGERGDDDGDAESDASESHSRLDPRPAERLKAKAELASRGLTVGLLCLVSLGFLLRGTAWLT